MVRQLSQSCPWGAARTIIKSFPHRPPMTVSSSVAGDRILYFVTSHTPPPGAHPPSLCLAKLQLDADHRKLGMLPSTPPHRNANSSASTVTLRSTSSQPPLSQSQQGGAWSRCASRYAVHPHEVTNGDDTDVHQPGSKQATSIHQPPAPPKAMSYANR